MNYWLTSDNHLGHNKVFEFEPDRKGFEHTLSHLKVVNPKDVLINLGDIGFKDSDKWIKAYCKTVQGKKILLKGNHDSNKSYEFFYKHGFDFVCERFDLYIYGRPLV